MDPLEVREERVTTTGGPVVPPVVPAAGYPAGTTFDPATGRPIVPVAPVAPVAYAPVAETHSYQSRSVYPVAYRSIQVVWFVIGLIDSILALDFLFRALGANDTGFASFIYSLGSALAGPFDGIFSNTASRGAHHVRWADIVAVLIYALIGYGIVKLIRINAAPRGRPRREL